jgi:hypothetical protein
VVSPKCDRVIRFGDSTPAAPGWARGAFRKFERFGRAYDPAVTGIVILYFGDTNVAR